jgi:hypothetical protein
MEPTSIAVFESWDFLVDFIGQADEVGDWEELSGFLRSGFMAIMVNGIPRLIETAIH